MEIINKILLKIYMSYLNNERLYHKIKLYVFMVYCSIVALSCSITIFMTHDLTILNNILFLLSMEYLQNSHLYYDFENYYSLIDLKNNNFLKNNLEEVEKKYIFAYTKEENFFNITNDLDCENNLIQDFKDWFKKFKKQPLYLEINEKNIIKDPELFNILSPQNLYQKNFEEDPKWDTLSDNANPDNEYEADLLDKEQIEIDKKQAEQKRVKAMNPNNNTMEDLSNIHPQQGSLDFKEVDKILSKHESFLRRWTRIFNRSLDYDKAERVFYRLSPEEQKNFISLMREIKVDSLTAKDLYRYRIDKLYLLKNAHYFENNPKLLEAINRSTRLSEENLHGPLESIKLDDDLQNTDNHFLNMFTQREKKYILFCGVKYNYGPVPINKIINTLDPGTRYYIRGTPFIYDLYDHRMHLLSPEQKSRIEYLHFMDKYGKFKGFSLLGNDWQKSHNSLTPSKRTSISDEITSLSQFNPSTSNPSPNPSPSLSPSPSTFPSPSPNPSPNPSLSPSPSPSPSEHSTISSIQETISIESYGFSSTDSESSSPVVSEASSPKDNINQNPNISQDNVSQNSNISQDNVSQNSKHPLTEESGLENPFKKLKTDHDENR